MGAGLPESLAWLVDVCFAAACLAVGASASGRERPCRSEIYPGARVPNNRDSSAAAVDLRGSARLASGAEASWLTW
jgi:hypothetical protein